MTGRDAVVISLEPWDRVWRRNQHLLTRLRAAGVLGRTLYVEPPTDPLHAARRRQRPCRGGGLRAAPDEPGLHLLQPTKLLPRRADPGQDRRWAASVTRAAGTVGLRDPLLWVNDPRGAEVLRATGWPALYDITDDWLLAPRGDAERERLAGWEHTLLAGCGQVVVCSATLAASKTATGPITLIPNGVDTAAYRRPHARPGDLPDGPVALYAGTLHADRLDVALCCAVSGALRATGATLVLLGPDALEPGDRTSLCDSGVRLLGGRPAPEVPAYLQHADTLVVPHVTTPFTASLDPIKAYEYAAAGRPVVSTPVAGFARGPGVHVAARDSFADAVLARTRQRADTIAVDVPDWSQRAAQFSRVVSRLGRTG